MSAPPRLARASILLLTVVVPSTVEAEGLAPYRLDGVDRVYVAAPREAGTPAVVPRSWPADIGETFGTPAMHDLDGDGRKEVIAADRQRTYVFDAQGLLRPGWPVSTGEVNNSPAVAYLDGDNVPEIIVASSGMPPRIHALRPDGSELPGFPVSLPYQYWLNVSCPVVADVDGDGWLDVGAQSEPGVAFFDHRGRPLAGWPYLWSTQQNIVWSAPAVADLDGDGSMEVVVGNNNLYSCAVHVIESDGTPKSGWPRGTENIFSSAAVGDLDGDGDMEIVVQEGDKTWYGNRMHVWHHDGSYLTGWPRAIAPQWESSRSNPSIVDIDADGSREILTATGNGYIHLFRVDGTELPGYPRAVPGSGPISTVQAVDADGDRIEELFLCHYMNGGQWVSGWHLDGTVLPGFPKILYAASELNAHGSTHVADADGDGDLDLVAQGGTFGDGKVWLYQVDGSSYVPGVTREESPKIRRDMHNTGAFTGKAPAAVESTTRCETSVTMCFPNPVRRSEWLEVAGLTGGNGRAIVVDVGGRGSREVRLQENGGATPGTKLFPVADLGPGAYILRWIPDRGRETAARFIVVP